MISNIRVQSDIQDDSEKVQRTTSNNVCKNVPSERKGLKFGEITDRHTRFKRRKKNYANLFEKW